MRHLTRREKRLSYAVGGVLFVVFNFAFINYLTKQHAMVKAQFAAKTSEWQTMQGLFTERELWEKRQAWIEATQPKLENEGAAGVQLLDQVKDAAKANGVTLENPAIGTLEKSSYYRSTPVNFETKSSWPALMKFLSGVQQPEQFIVVDNANIQIEAADTTLIRGKFRVSRWYAP